MKRSEAIALTVAPTPGMPPSSSASEKPTAWNHTAGRAPTTTAAAFSGMPAIDSPKVGLILLSALQSPPFPSGNTGALTSSSRPWAVARSAPARPSSLGTARGDFCCAGGTGGSAANRTRPVGARLSPVTTESSPAGRTPRGISFSASARAASDGANTTNPSRQVKSVPSIGFAARQARAPPTSTTTRLPCLVPSPRSRSKPAASAGGTVSSSTTGRFPFLSAVGIQKATARRVIQGSTSFSRLAPGAACRNSSPTPANATGRKAASAPGV